MAPVAVNELLITVKNTDLRDIGFTVGTGTGGRPDANCGRTQTARGQPRADEDDSAKLPTAALIRPS